MKVRVIERFGDGWHLRIVTVTIADTCPVCDGPRGEPVNRNFCEDDEWFSCDVWENPCGHVDLYRDVLAEARKAELQPGEGATS